MAVLIALKLMPPRRQQLGVELGILEQVQGGDDSARKPPGANALNFRLDLRRVRRAGHRYVEIRDRHLLRSHGYFRLRTVERPEICHYYRDS
jgi:hypothetical protein